MTEQELTQLLHMTGALLEGHFLLSSGLHSDKYIQCAKLLQYPDLAEEMGTLLAGKLNSAEIQKPNVIASPAIGGIIIGQEVGRALGIRHIFVEKDDLGKPVLKRGFQIDSDDTFVVVEDVITTGKSTKEVIEVLKALGGKPLAVLAIVNRSGKNEPIEGLPLLCLMNMDLLVYNPQDCPLCKSGLPIEKPGSRKI